MLRSYGGPMTALGSKPPLLTAGTSSGSWPTAPSIFAQDSSREASIASTPPDRTSDTRRSPVRSGSSCRFRPCASRQMLARSLWSRAGLLRPCASTPKFVPAQGWTTGLMARVSGPARRDEMGGAGRPGPGGRGTGSGRDRHPPLSGREHRPDQLGWRPACRPEPGTRPEG